MIIFLMFPMWFLGTFIFIKILLPSKPPTDKSNVINRIRLVWFSLTRQELFVGTFAWLAKDELDNVKGKQ